MHARINRSNLSNQYANSRLLSRPYLFEINSLPDTLVPDMYGNLPRLENNCVGVVESEVLTKQVWLHKAYLLLPLARRYSLRRSLKKYLQRRTDTLGRTKVLWN